MAKGRVSERSPTGALQTTPAGDRAAGTRDPTAPGSGGPLKGKWNQEPELGPAQRRECAGRGSGGEKGPQQGAWELLGQRACLLAPGAGEERVGDLGLGRCPRQDF